MKTIKHFFGLLVLVVLVLVAGVAASADLSRNRNTQSPDPKFKPVRVAGQEKPIPTNKVVLSDSNVGWVKVQTWNVKSGDYLRETLSDWVARAGWNLVWAAGDKDDFQFLGSNTFHSSFKDAVTDLFASFPSNIHLRNEMRIDNDPPMLYVTRDEGTQK